MRFNSNSEVKVVYMGTPEISASVLTSILEAGFDVVAVVTNEDKESGRRHELEPTPVKKVALSHNIPVFQPHRIRKDHSFLDDLSFDVLVTMAYGQIVPKEVLDAPRIGAINLHGSLLPSLRGAAPIQRAIMNGDKVTGVTLMKMVEAMDAGEMYDKIEVEIAPEDNYTSLAWKISKAASALIVKDLLRYANGELPGVSQEESQVTFANKILPEDERLPLSLPISSLLCYIRGLSEAPGGYFLLDGKKLKVYKASISSLPLKGEIGEIVKCSKGIYMQVDGGILSLDDVQLEGKKRMDGKSFSNGASYLLGKVLR